MGPSRRPRGRWREPVLTVGLAVRLAMPLVGIGAAVYFLSGEDPLVTLGVAAAVVMLVLLVWIVRRL